MPYTFKKACCRLIIATFGAAAMFLLASKECRAQDDEVRKFINDVRSAPILYRTPQAVDYFSSVSGYSAPVAFSQDQRDAAVQGLRAAIKLGDLGQKAVEAVSVLIDMFPRLEHVVAKRSVHYTPGNGTLEDWVQTFLVSEKNNFIFSSPFVEYASLSKCENWIEASPVTNILSKKVGGGGKITDAVADIFIILRVNAAACALARITGIDNGINQEAWRMWRLRSSGATPPGSFSPQDNPGITQTGKNAFADIAVGGRYKFHLVTNDDMSGTITSRDDSSLTIKTDAGTPYNFRIVLIEKYDKIVPVVNAPAPAPETNPVPATVTLTFDDLLQGRHFGAMLEVRVRNGSIFKGTFLGAAGESARLSVEGSELSISRKVITAITLLSK